MRRPDERLWIEATTVGDLVDRAAAEAEGDALIFPGERASYAELAAATDTYARALRALGVGPGDKVGMLMPNCLDFATAFIAATKLGAVSVPINGRFKTHELAHVIEHADIHTLLTAAGPEVWVDYPAMLTEVFGGLDGQDPAALRLAGAPLLRRLVNMNGDRPGFMTRDAFLSHAGAVELADVRRLQQRVRIRDIAMLMYTSGTTARPKGCLQTHEALVRHGGTVDPRPLRCWLPTTASGTPLPLFHIGGITPMLGCIGARRHLVTQAHFDAGRRAPPARARAHHGRISRLRPIWLAVLDHPRLRRARTERDPAGHAASRRPSGCGSFSERLRAGAADVTSYGATECCAVTSRCRCRRTPDELRMTTLGEVAPAGWSSRIVDPETGDDLPPGTVGELCFRGYARFEALPQRPRADGAGDRRRRLVPHGRPRLARRGRAAHVPRPAQGHAQGRRRERRRARGRGLPRRATRR